MSVPQQDKLAAQQSHDDDRARLCDCIIQDAIIHGDVVLSSGVHAQYYVDLRRVTLAHHGSALIGKLMRDLLAEWDFDAVGGLTMGADPVATAIMHAPGRPIDAFVVRKEAKRHGLSRRVEGPNIDGKKVVIVEDSATTGESALTAARAAQEAGAQVVGIATVVDRDTGSAQRIAAAGYPFKSLLGLNDLGLAQQCES